MDMSLKPQWKPHDVTKTCHVKSTHHFYNEERSLEDSLTYPNKISNRRKEDSNYAFRRKPISQSHSHAVEKSTDAPGVFSHIQTEYSLLTQPSLTLWPQVL